MAVRDVKEYYIVELNQLITLKADLAEFESAVKAGHITEDRLEEIKTECHRLQENVDRLGYILYLLELPNRKSKQQKYMEATANINEYFKNKNADKKSELSENDTIIKFVKAELERITKTK